MADLLVNIDVGDLEQAVEFYTEGLDLRVRRRLGSDIAELAGASSRVFLTQHEGDTRPVSGGSATREYKRHWTPVHLDFVVADLEAATQKAEAAGATPEGDIREFDWGRFRVMADPFGNGFCIVQFKGQGYGEIT
jgi:predicted enzyme related to lactoylglutathione lyase